MHIVWENPRTIEIITEYVLSKAYHRLRNTAFGIDRDYPNEIARARKVLYQSDDAREAKGRHSKVQIGYPARLFIDRKLVKDSFPDWFQMLHESRIDFDGEIIDNMRSTTSTNPKKDSNLNHSAYSTHDFGQPYKFK